MQRRFFTPSDKPEVGRHLSYKHRVEGKYAFRKYQGGGNPTEQVEAYKSITKELQAIIAEAIDTDKEIRVQGSSWSLSKVGLAKDRLVNSKMLRLLRFNLPKSMISRRYEGDHQKLRFVECGESISRINQMLFRERLSLKASGANNGQTLAGALSTGTHGGAFNFGAVPDFVVGLHLVVGPSKHVYLQRKSAPVVTKKFTDLFETTLVEDDDLFDSALVSFGSFGIIHGILIETRELFMLHAARFFHPFNRALKTAMSSLDFSGIDLSRSDLPADAPTDRPYHFQVYFNPNEGTPPKRASVLLMFEDDWSKFSNDYEPPEWDDGEPGPGAAGLELAGAIFDNLPSIIGEAIVPFLNVQIADQLGPYYKRAVVRDMFRGEIVEGPLLSSDTAVPMSRALEALDIAFETYADFGTIMPVIISSRFVKGTKALLGFTKFDQNVTVEIDTISTPKSRAYVNRFRRNLEKAGIPFTLHWGKLESFLTPTRLRKIYGDNLDRWLQSRKTLLENEAVRKAFTNEFMTRLDLA